MKVLSEWLLAIAFLCTCWQIAESARILAVFPFPGPSQYIFVESYLKNLASRGHEVTVINAFEPKENTARFRVLPVLKVHEKYDELVKEASVKMNHWQLMHFQTQFIKNLCLTILEDKGVQKLMQSNEKFDLLIVEIMQSESLYGLSQHFNAVTIGVSSYGTDHTIDSLVGNISPLSYNPMVTYGFTDHMSYGERFRNVWRAILEKVHRYIYDLPMQEEIYNQYFSNAKVPLKEVVKNFSLLLLGQHFSLSYPRPYVPCMIEVGGLHLKEHTKSLPPDIANFIDGAQHGVIYFSMGSNIKSKDLPKEVINGLLTTFATLKQRVLWKFEEELPEKPANVFISKWFSQPDILAHPHVKLFITHGGLLSTIEAIYYGKPVLGIPIFYDQYLNVERAKTAGFGLGLSIEHINSVDLNSHIERLINNASFTDAAKRLSSIYRDQPMNAMEKAIYWTEYVLRHKGAPHLRVAALNLNVMQLYSLDTIAPILGGVTLLILFLTVFAYKLCSIFANSRKTKQKVH